MSKYIYIIAGVLIFFYTSCDNANDLLNQHIKDGPIVYAGKIDTLRSQSGYYRLRVNLFPTEDVNRSHCILRWNVSNGAKDSVKVDYIPSNYDSEMGCYYTFVSTPDIEGNLLVEAQNIDAFGNKSLIVSEGTFIYGSTYVSTLLNSSVGFSSDSKDIIFENRVGSVGNLISYEQNNGQFTEEIIAIDRYTLIDAKRGGIVRSKTRYLMNETDVDTLVTATYLETVIP